MAHTQETDGSSNQLPYMSGRNTELTMEEALGILRRENLEAERKVISWPPVLPKGGEVFVYCSPSSYPDHKQDYRFDQYRWVDKGRNYRSDRRYQPIVFKRKYHLKDPNGSGNDALHGFQRFVYWLRECSDPKQLFLIHYLGDETLYEPSAHGNRKGVWKPFVASKNQPFIKIEKSLESQKAPMKTYKQLQSTTSVGSSEKQMATDCPRNLNQVPDVSCLMKLEHRLGDDEIFNLVELSEHLPKFIRSITLVPDVVVSFAHPDILDEARTILSLSKEDPDLPQLVSYDTTFKLGDFYLSPLVMRNITLERDPVFPIAFLLHTGKCMQYHSDFLRDILSTLGVDYMTRIPFVTDRERGIVQPLHELFPQIPHVFCHNHILRDVRMWLKKNGGKKDDLEVLMDNMKQLLDSATMREYQEKYGWFSVLWSPPFKDYFDHELNNCLPKHAIKCCTQRFAAFQNNITATNNIRETMNKVIKDEMQWRDMPADSMVLAMYYMQTYYLYEFQCAHCGLGNYTPKQQYSKFQKTQGEVPMHPFHPLDEILENIRSKQREPNFKRGVKKEKGYCMTQTSLAEDCVDSQISLAEDCVNSGGVNLCSQSATFTVRDVNSDRMQAVKLFPEPAHCSCGSTGKCYHIIATEMSIGRLEKVKSISNCQKHLQL